METAQTQPPDNIRAKTSSYFGASFWAYYFFIIMFLGNVIHVL